MSTGRFKEGGMNMITSNIPREKYVIYNNENFYIGNEVRILYVNHNGIIGWIYNIDADGVDIRNEIGIKYIPFSEIKKMRHTKENEDLDTVPYYDEEEKEFWRTHWCTKDGIKEKTEEDIKMLEEFFEKWK